MEKTTPNSSGDTHTKAHHEAPTQGFGMTERELKKKDDFQRRLTVVFDWMIANKVLLIMGLGVILLSGVGIVSYNKVKRDTHLKIHDSYFAIEKEYLKAKDEFAEAARLAKVEEDKKKDPKAKSAKTDSKEESAAPKKPVASGDLEKDYGRFVTRFTELHSANPKSVPGKMAALMLADVYTEYKKLDLALPILEKSNEPKPSQLIDFLVLKKLNSTWLSLGQFDKVIADYSKSKSALEKYPFMKSHFKVQVALAHEGAKQLDQAELIYKEVIATVDDKKVKDAKLEAQNNEFESNQSAAELARKYLMLLKLKQSELTAGN